MRKKRILRNTLLLFLIATVYALVLSFLLQGFSHLSAQINPVLDFVQEAEIVVEAKEQGRVIAVNLDAETKRPIRNTEFVLLDQVTREVIDTFTTDELGRGRSDFFEYGRSFILKQNKIMSPYQVDPVEHQLEMRERNVELRFKNSLPDYIKSYEYTEEGRLRIREVYIPVETVLQLPELPNGCEVTSLTSVLNTYGYDVSKLQLADDYLPQEPFTTWEGRLYGANPYHAYAGNPRKEPGGFFTYPPPVIVAGERYLAEVGGKEQIYDVSGSSREEIVNYLNEGIPVIIWVTRDLSPPRINYSWYLKETHEYFPAPVNLHNVVLHGYTETEVQVMDPLKGQLKLDADTFFASYEALGSHAIIIKK